MKVICSVTFLAFFILSACSKKEEVKGIIFERKELSDNLLLIRYSYAYNNKTYYDSVTVSNKVLPIDTINIIIDPLVPTHALPVLSGR